jgi:hypothetical protein
MRRFLMFLPSLMLLAACADGPPPGGPQIGVTASFPPGGVVGVIKVNALDTQPLRAAQLVAPDGTAYAASSLDVDANPQTRAGQSALGDPWRSSMLGNNNVNPLPNGTPDPTVRTQTQLLLTVSTADISVPDMVAYRRDWTNYKLRLSFAGPDSQPEIREIPAPQPPPS